MTVLTGGCQCGAIRYQLKKLGKASICHCRMCQKAMGNYFAPLVEVEGFKWVRGQRAVFPSSNLSLRGFCSNCGTPMTLETGEQIELAIATLDDPSVVPIEYHANVEDRLAVSMCMHKIPDADKKRTEENIEWNSRIISFQHPDHDTSEWPQKS